MQEHMVKLSVRVPAFGGNLVTLVRPEDEAALVKPIFNTWVDLLTGQGALVLNNSGETWVWIDDGATDPADAATYIAWERTTDLETPNEALLGLDERLQGLVTLMNLKAEGFPL